MNRVPEQDTQNLTVLKHLKEVGPITNMEIMGKYHISGPRARIKDLRKQEQFEDVEVLDRTVKQNGKTFKQYYLASNPPADLEPDRYETRALSIRQPWAWLIVNGYKTIENRNWNTDYRGWFWIHTGQQKAENDQTARLKFSKLEGDMIPPMGSLKKGGIIGKARLTEVITPESVCDDPWYDGDFGFVLEDARRVDFVPCSGQLKFFQLAEGVKNELYGEDVA